MFKVFILYGYRQTGKKRGLGAEKTPRTGRPLEGSRTAPWERPRSNLRSQMTQFPRYLFQWFLGPGGKPAGEGRERQRPGGLGNWKSGPSSALNWLSHLGHATFRVTFLICEVGAGPPTAVLGGSLRMFGALGFIFFFFFHLSVKEFGSLSRPFPTLKSNSYFEK